MFAVIIVVGISLAGGRRRVRRRRQQPIARALNGRRLVLQCSDVNFFVGLVFAGLGRRRRGLAAFQRLAHEVRQPLHHHYCREDAAPRRHTDVPLYVAHTAVEAGLTPTLTLLISPQLNNTFVGMTEGSKWRD